MKNIVTLSLVPTVPVCPIIAQNEIAFRQIQNVLSTDALNKACHRSKIEVTEEKDIKFVVASHLHLDHAGCLEMFTNATIIVHEDELNGTLQSYARNQKEGAYVWADIDAWIKNNLQWQTVKRSEDKLELAEGISVLNFGSGHAWGMLGLHVQMPETGGIILASDAIYTAESFGPPIKPPGIIYDSIGYSNTVERIRKLAKETNSQVWFGHDSEQFKNFRKSTEGYYE